MPIFVFCPRCQHEINMDILKTTELEHQIDAHKMYCEVCGHTWWEVDDYRGEEE